MGHRTRQDKLATSEEIPTCRIALEGEDLLVDELRRGESDPGLMALIGGRRPNEPHDRLRRRCAWRSGVWLNGCVDGVVQRMPSLVTRIRS